VPTVDGFLSNERAGVRCRETTLQINGLRVVYAFGDGARSGASQTENLVRTRKNWRPGW